MTDDTDPHDHYDSTLRELAREHGIEYRYIRFDIEDLGIPTRELMGEILAAIKTELDEGRPVYFHWLGGIGRTGGRGLLAGGAGDVCRRCAGAVQMLRWGSADSWKRSPETDEQCAFVRGWSKR